MRRLSLIYGLAFLLCGCNQLNKLYDHQRPTSTNEQGVMRMLPVNQKPLVGVLAGQSNMVGYLRSPSEAQYGISHTGRVKIKPHIDWDFIRPTAEHPLDRSLAMVVCADILAEHYHREIQFINVAQGGTTTEQWKTIYLSRLIKGVVDYKADFVAWHQGEEDYTQGLTEEQSYENMKAIILAVKQERDIPFIIALNSIGAALDAYPDRNEIPIRKAQMRLIREGLAVQGPDTDTLRDLYPTDEGRVHFLNEGVKAHGELWAQAIIRLFVSPF